VVWGWWWVGEQHRHRQLQWRVGGGGGLGLGGCIAWGGQGLLVNPSRHRRSSQVPGTIRMKGAVVSSTFIGSCSGGCAGVGCLGLGCWEVAGVGGGWVGGWVGEQRRRRQLPWRGGGLGWSGLGVQGGCVVWGGQGLLVDPRRHRPPNF
jgi:hypothetical protein